MKKYLIIILLFSLGSYKVMSQGNLKFTLNYGHKKPELKLTIPWKFKTVKMKAQNAELMEVETSALIPDSSVIYITDNLNAGGGINAYKIDKYGPHYILKNYLEHDTATLYGIHNGKCWREVKYYLVTVGYYNVSQEKKYRYDQILADIKQQVDQLRRDE